MHIANRVNMDEKADSRNHQGHQDGERIDLVSDDGLERAGDNPIEDDFLKETLRRGFPDQFEDRLLGSTGAGFGGC